MVKTNGWIGAASSAVIALGCLGTFLAGPAEAGERGAPLEFCKTATSDCRTLIAGNLSSSVVVATNVTEEGEGCSGEKKRHSANMIGASIDPGFFKIIAKKNCTYRVNFKTTDGCIGDKQIRLTPERVNNGRDTARLDGACGSLKAKATWSMSTDDDG